MRKRLVAVLMVLLLSVSALIADTIKVDSFFDIYIPMFCNPIPGGNVAIGIGDFDSDYPEFEEELKDVLVNNLVMRVGSYQYSDVPILEGSDTTASYYVQNGVYDPGIMRLMCMKYKVNVLVTGSIERFEDFLGVRLVAFDMANGKVLSESVFHLEPDRKLKHMLGEKATGRGEGRWNIGLTAGYQKTDLHAFNEFGAPKIDEAKVLSPLSFGMNVRYKGLGFFYLSLGARYTGEYGYDMVLSPEEVGTIRFSGVDVPVKLELALLHFPFELSATGTIGFIFPVGDATLYDTETTMTAPLEGYGLYAEYGFGIGIPAGIGNIVVNANYLEDGICPTFEKTDILYRKGWSVYAGYEFCL